jgi:DNA-binding response OmpR family regulator
MDIHRGGGLSSRVLHDSITTSQPAHGPSGRGYVPVAAAAENTSTLYAGELEIRLGEGLVLATGRALTLSVREFELLAAMARHAGAIVTRDELYAEVYVSKLRNKLETAMPDRRFIHTHPGFGYRFQPQPARETAAVPDATDALEVADAADEAPGELSRNVHIGAVGDS